MNKRSGILLFEFGLTLPLLAVTGLVIMVALSTYTKAHTAVRNQTFALDRAQQVLLDLQAGRATLDAPPEDVRVEVLESPQPQLKWVRVSVGRSASLIGAIPVEVSR